MRVFVCVREKECVLFREMRERERERERERKQCRSEGRVIFNVNEVTN